MSSPAPTALPTVGARLGGGRRFLRRYLVDTLTAVLGGRVYGALVWRAAEVQAADPRFALFGAGVGAFFGVLIWKGRLSPGWPIAGVGALGGLQFFRCWMCDGSPFAMPILGGLFAAFCWATVRAGVALKAAVRRR